MSGQMHDGIQPEILTSFGVSKKSVDAIKCEEKKTEKATHLQWYLRKYERRLDKSKNGLFLNSHNFIHVTYC